MAENGPLAYTQGVLEHLRASYEHMEREELLDLVCHLQKSYVLDQTIPFDFPLPERVEELRTADGRADRPDTAEDEENPEDPAEVRFARLIDGLKRRTGLPQFQGFAVEAGKATLVVDNQKVTFGERVTVEFVPLRGPTPTPARPTAPARPTPPGPSAPRPAAPPRPTAVGSPGRPSPSRPAPTQPAPKPDPEPEDGYDASVERFRRLDLD